MSSMPPERRDAVVRHIAEVPRGDLDEAALPEEWRARFAVIRGSDGSAVVLAAPEAFGGVAMFDIKRRLEERGGAPRFLRATPEILTLLRDQRRTAAPVGLAGEDATNIEKTALDLVEAALDRGASDLHIETRNDHAAVYLRINGQRQLFCHLSIGSARGLGVVLYSVHADAASKDITWDPQQVMDGVIEHRRPSGQAVQLRFSSAPIFPTGNFHIVIRLLRMEASRLTLEDLGYSHAQQAWLDRVSGTLSGLLLFCGPTNSGKSTTLQALMQHLYGRYGDTLKTITVEDPVEYVVEGACQISVPRRRRQQEGGGSAFTSFLRGTLRQDPDVVMIGEIRDAESAAVAKDLVLAGRKVLTTLHTYSALWAFPRLRELGLPLELLTMPGFVSGIVYQRLVPVLCAACAAPCERGALNADLWARLAPWLRASDRPRLRGPGCPACGESGVATRTVCAEVLEPELELLEHVAHQRYREAESAWQAGAPVRIEGLGVTALAQGIAKLREGAIDPRDLERYVGLPPNPPSAPSAPSAPNTPSAPRAV